jgi:hypothetical protein
MSAPATGAQPLPRPSGFGKTIRDLLPLAVALLIFAAAEWYLLSQGWLLGTWTLAAFLAFHGLIHLMFLSPKQPEAGSAGGAAYPFDPARSWLVTRTGLSAGAVRGLAAVLSAVVAIGFVLAGLATIGLIVPTDWWASLVVGSSILSLVLFVLTFSPSLALGIAIDLVLLWVVWSGAWLPGA